MELRDYLNVIRARRSVIIQAVIVVTLTAVIASLLQAPTYQGVAKVLVTEKDTGAALFGTLLPELSSQPERGLQTQVQLMQLRPLAENTIRKLALGISPDELLKRVDVTAVGQTNIVTIKATDPDSQRAADIANVMAEEYVAWSKDYKRESLKTAADEVETRLEEAKQQVLELGRKVQAEGKSDQLAAELQIAAGTYSTLADKLEQLRINEQLEIGSGRVVSSAVLDPAPVAPSPVRNGGLGLVVGLVFGVGMAFLYEYLDNTIKSSEETEKLFNAPVLGTIPAEKFEKGEGRRLTLVTHPGSPAAEAYRVLRNSLDFVNFEHKIKTLLVTSPAPGEGKSTVAANLAAGLAQAGEKVVLLSCDFRRPTTEQFFGVNNSIGLSDVLLGHNSLKAAMQKPGSEQLMVLTAGKMPPNPSELLGSQKMQELVRELEKWADWVIIDTPPLLAVADPAAVARWADGVLVVMKGGVSTKDAAKKAAEMLAKVGARTVGVVVWGLEPGASAAGYGYGYGYGGYYYYHDYYNHIPPQGRSKRRQADSGAKGTASLGPGVMSAEEPEVYIPLTSPGREALQAMGKLLSGVLAFVMVLAVAALVAYFADQAFGWGLIGRLMSVVG